MSVFESTMCMHYDLIQKLYKIMQWTHEYPEYPPSLPPPPELKDGDLIMYCIVSDNQSPPSPHSHNCCLWHVHVISHFNLPEVSCTSKKNCYIHLSKPTVFLHQQVLTLKNSTLCLVNRSGPPPPSKSIIGVAPHDCSRSHSHVSKQGSKMLPSSGRTEFSLKGSTINFSTLYILWPSDLRVVGGRGRFTR